MEWEEGMQEINKEAFKKDVEVMWKKVQYITSRDPRRFSRKLASWTGQKIQKGWQPKDIKETLEEFVRFEDGHGKIQEYYPYLNRILQARKTREHQVSSEQHKEYDPNSFGGILKKMIG